MHRSVFLPEQTADGQGLCFAASPVFSCIDMVTNVIKQPPQHDQATPITQQTATAPIRTVVIVGGGNAGWLGGKQSHIADGMHCRTRVGGGYPVKSSRRREKKIDLIIG